MKKMTESTFRAKLAYLIGVVSTDEADVSYKLLSELQVYGVPLADVMMDYMTAKWNETEGKAKPVYSMALDFYNDWLPHYIDGCKEEDEALAHQRSIDTDANGRRW